VPDHDEPWCDGHGVSCVRQSSVRRLLILLLALLATPAQDLNSSSTSIFPHTGLTSAYPSHYSGHLLLEPSLPSGHTAHRPNLDTQLYKVP
jgi:hypothetical protein